jgi:sortase A
MGQWRQQEQAAADDLAIPRYHNSMSAAYDVLTSDFEDALVSYEVGARPTPASGFIIAPTALPAAFPASVVAQQVSSEPTGSTLPEANPVTTQAQPQPVFSAAVIRIPKIGLSQAVGEGVSRDDLKQGPGHYPGTAVPGFMGNTVISGHRTTYTRPFFDLDLLAVGDAIIVDTPAGSYRYLVESAHVVADDDVSLLQSTDRSVLTLTTCTPKGSAQSRLIIVSVLAGMPVDAAP